MMQDNNLMILASAAVRISTGPLFHIPLRKCEVSNGQ